MILDIETYGDTLPNELEPSMDNISAPSNYKDPEKINAYKLEKLKDSQGEKALSPLTGRIICYGLWKDDDEAPELVLHKPEDDYVAFLTGLKTNIDGLFQSGETLVTYNGKAFDIPFIISEFARCGLPSRGSYSHLLRRYNSDHHNDLFEFFGKHSLHKWALRYGCAKDKSAGADVGMLYAQGRYSEVISHCKADVEETEALYRKLSAHL